MASENTFLDRGIIEVPPELRGPSNEEILQKEGRADTAMRRRAAMRPSKRERLQRKLGESSVEMRKIAANFAEETPRRPVFEPARSPVQERPVRKESRISFARKKLESLFSREKKIEKQVIPQVLPQKEPPKPVVRSEPPSGRVLKGSFGAKPSDSAHAQVYSAAELNRIRMEERAKKIREALALKNKPQLPVGEDGLPIKRPRGRPRKNPLP